MPDEAGLRLSALVRPWRASIGTPSPRLAAIAGGSESAPWQVAGPGGRFVLRAYGLGAAAAERAALALAASGAASRQGVLAPRPVPTDAGEAFGVDADGRVWALVRWLPGRPRRSWLALDADQARALGSALAGLHAALRCLPPDLAGPGAQGVGVLRHGRSQDQILHGDPSQGNVLWRGRGTAVAVGLIDFDRADRGPVERDLARALVGMAPWAGAGSPRVFPAFLAGYVAAGGRPSATRLRASIPRALAEGEAWLERADLSPKARRAGGRWLARARAVALTPVLGTPLAGAAPPASRRGR